MRKSVTFLAAIMLALPFQAKENEEIIKSGWNFGPLPVVGFDSDLGFQYGLCCDIFNYGNGSNYPKYDFKINVEASTYTKGSSILRSYGDFKNLIPDGKFFYDVTYFNAPKFGFYGFNGFASPYESEYKEPKANHLIEPDAKAGYNFMARNQFRVITSMQKNITGNLNWAAGLAYYNIQTDALNIKDYEGQNTLYEKYVDKGLIKENEKNGGNVTQIRAGLVYDSRDHDSDPTSGYNIEGALVFSPDIIDREGYTNLGLTCSASEFTSFCNDRLTLAFRELIQVNLCGDIPWYFTNNINNMFFRKLYTEGVGGNASVRGINRNGVLGRGFYMINLELRWRAVDFKFINQNWTLAFNPFIDDGGTLQPYRLNEQKSIGDNKIWSGKNDDSHITYGGGAKLIMNHNMVISFEAAKAMDKNDGEGLWTNIGFNYLF